MSKRVYNVLFHLHTISGIIISAVLYIIFFAGSFSFFRDEITNWERNHTVVSTDDIRMDYDAALDTLDAKYLLKGRDIEITKYYRERRVSFNLTAPKDTTIGGQGQFFYLDTKTHELTDYFTAYTLGEFIYRLHFLAQIPYPVGYYLAGFVALFFLFAIITGILVHWKKIVSNFFVFRPWAKLKTLWTDAHTALGTIGLPFQFVYAVTGAFFMIKAVLIAPSVWALYDGDEAAFYADLGYNEPVYEYAGEPLTTAYSLNEMAASLKTDWPEFNISHVHIINYGDANMHISIEGAGPRDKQLTAPGKRVYKVATKEIVDEHSPLVNAGYVEGVKNVMYRIHYGDYGGYLLKLMSFALGILTCFVIISGVMIWLVARDKKNVSEAKKKFNNWLVNIYMAICLSIYPVTALAFVIVKVYGISEMTLMYKIYFVPWLVVSTFLIAKRDNFFTTKFSLIAGGIIGFMIPLVNGIVTGNWVWVSFSQGFSQIFLIDIFWVVLSVCSLFAGVKAKTHQP